ncbi:hypothetical protein TRICI_001441 [Trichomonascus ciferrii]|uniref:thioredoxin-dependent peroxiredoxin n=1 Tax=Trichomonascus ciferrii TaxID=44093 RepID=A0A642VA03_9ASCO|nr:hypothetical protein TRICI_001441 [Trichomonascus ciferrii]
MSDREGENKPRRSKRVEEKNATVDEEKKEEGETETLPPKLQRRQKMREELKAKKEAAKLPIGSEIPNVTLPNQDGDDVNLNEVSKEHPVVVFVYPRANTSGCTRQAQSYVKKYEEFEKYGAKVYGLSIDAIKSNKKFQKKFGMQFDLLCDPEQKLLKPLGCKKGARGTSRSQFVFVDGKLVESTYEVKPDKSVGFSLQGIHQNIKNPKNSDDDDDSD